MIAEGYGYTEQASINSWDAMMNIEVRFLCCGGLYLIQMRTASEDDTIVRSANFYLKKSIFVWKSYKHQKSGHHHCLGARMCSEVVEDCEARIKMWV